MRFIALTQTMSMLSYILLMLLATVLGNDLKVEHHQEINFTFSPNMLIFMINDVKTDDFVLDSMRSTQAQRHPTINKLAKNGILLTEDTVNQLSQSIPSRSTIHSKQSNNNNAYLSHLAQKLQSRGYHTISIGKWELKGKFPRRKGFQEYFDVSTSSSQLMDRSDSYCDYDSACNMIERYDANAQYLGYSYFCDEVVTVEGIPKLRKHTTDLYTETAITKLATAETSKPFLLLLSYQAMIDPLEVPLRYIDGTVANGCDALIDDDYDGQPDKVRCGMVSQLDHSAYELVGYLKSSDQWDNTVFLFLPSPINGASKALAVLSGGYVESSLLYAGAYPFTFQSPLPLFEFSRKVFDSLLKFQPRLLGKKHEFLEGKEEEEMAEGGEEDEKREFELYLWSFFMHGSLQSRFSNNKVHQELSSHFSTATSIPFDDLPSSSSSLEMNENYHDHLRKLAKLARHYDRTLNRKLSRSTQRSSPSSSSSPPPPPPPSSSSSSSSSSLSSSSFSLPPATELKSPKRELALSSYQILSLLYASSAGASSWYGAYNWLEGSPCPSGDWYGISCSSDNVIALSLEYNNLQGYLPSQIGLLNTLESFSIYANELTGSIPSQFGLLSNLNSYIEFDDNLLTGAIPSQFGQLTQMKYLIYLNGNYFSHQLPSEFGQLTAFSQGMYLYSNSFTGLIPSQLGQLSLFYSSLYLYSNSFTGSLPSQLGQLSKVSYYFRINSNSLSGTIPSEIGQMSLLRSYFGLYSNAFTGSIPSEMGLLTLLSTYFALYRNSFSGSIPFELGQLTSLTSSFYLHLNSLSGRIPTQLGQLTKMSSYYYFYSNSLSGSLPSQLGQLSLMTNYLYGYSNNLCDDIPSEVISMLSGVSSYNIATDNMFGTLCCQALPSIFTCAPSPVPTNSPTLLPTLSILPTNVPTFVPIPVPTALPSALPTTLPSPIPSPSPTSTPTLLPTPSPTQVPTVNCQAGTYYDGLVCTNCAIGQYSNFTIAPFPSNCSNCPAGQYNTQAGLSQCTECDTGKLSSEDRTYCKDCGAGEYSYNDLECVACPFGQYAPQALTDSCLSCAAGFRTNNNTAATSCISCSAGFYSTGLTTTCSSCPAGTWSSYSAPECEDCSVGTYASSSESSSCSSCSAGEYTNQVGTVDCSQCSLGQYQSSTGQTVCVRCEPGTYSSARGAVLCSNCALKYDSYVGASSCTLASKGYYLVYDSGSEASNECPHNAECVGGDSAPAPNKGYWVDRTSYDYVTDIYSCPRLTCKGTIANGSCWTYGAYNVSTLDEGQCHANDLLCSEGAQGPLCGSCAVGYVFRGETKACLACGSAKRFAFTALAVAGAVLISMGVLVWGYYSDNPITHFLKSFDSGSLKVLWVTYQIIMSVSWNLDVEFPKVFANMLAIFSVFSLDILSLECFQSQSDDRYFVTVYLWCLVPFIFVFLIFVICLIRMLTAQDYRSRTKIINQHIWMFLLLTYLVLPPVAMKQLQSLDCIPFSHNDSLYLRVDTGVNCESDEYLVFKSIIILFFSFYQLIPVFWMGLLYRHRTSLFIPHNSNEEFALKERDLNQSLSHIRFLFKDYKGDKWWFEVAEMYRRIMFIGVLPLFTPVASKRASLGCIFAIFSIVYFREEEPFRVEFTNTIAYIAQFTILLTFYAALSIETGAMIGFGLGDFGVGIFLIIVNLLVVTLVLYLASNRFRRMREEMHWKRALNTQQLAIVNAVMDEEEDFELSLDRMSTMGNDYCDDNENGDIEMKSFDVLPSKKDRKRSLGIDVLGQFLLQPRDVVMSKRIGAGAFGEVFKGLCLGERVAVKTMIDVTEANVRDFRAEILLTAMLRHPNIVNFVGACWGRELMCLVLEWVAKGTLRNFLETPDLRWDDPLLRLATDIARGMNYLHNRKYFDEVQKEQRQCILHRDLKPDNVLVSDFIAGKIADFGTSRSKAAREVTMTAVGTPLYVAPEICRGDHYDEKVDVYSFGLTLAEMSVQDIFDFIGKRWKTHFNKKKIPVQKTRMIRPMTEDGWRPVTKEHPIPHAPPGINDLIIRCCAHDPKERPSFKEILDEFNGKVKVEVDRRDFGRKSFLVPNRDDDDDNNNDNDVSENMRYTESAAAAILSLEDDDSDDEDDESRGVINGNKPTRKKWVHNPSLKGDELLHRPSTNIALGQSKPLQEQDLLSTFNANSVDGIVTKNTYI